MMSREKAKKLANALLNLREAISDDQAQEFSFLYSTWREAVEYFPNQRILHKDCLYRVLEHHISDKNSSPEFNSTLFAKINKE